MKKQIQRTNETCWSVRPEDRVEKKNLYFFGFIAESTYLEVAVDHAHLVAVEHSL